MTRQQIFAVITKNIQAVIDGSNAQIITESNRMGDYAADSIEIVDVVSRTMKELNITIPLSSLAGASDLKDLTDLFERAVAAHKLPSYPRNC
ncbi:MAG: phosphopantetheine-binding protein [Microcoleus sp.]